MSFKTIEKMFCDGCGADFDVAVPALTTHEEGFAHEHLCTICFSRLIIAVGELEPKILNVVLRHGLTASDFKRKKP